jgi:hypothetical protein
MGQQRNSESGESSYKEETEVIKGIVLRDLQWPKAGSIDMSFYELRLRKIMKIIIMTPSGAGQTLFRTSWY